MPDLAAALRLYRRLIGAEPPAAPGGAGEADPGIAATATGAEAVAAVEAALADVVAVDASWPAVAGATSGAEAAGERLDLPGLHAAPATAATSVRAGDDGAGEGLNLLGRRADTVVGGVAAAAGLATAGERAAALVGGADLERRLEPLASAAARRLPLVVHLACGAGGRGGGAAAGGDHGTAHAAAAAGAVTLFAADVQEAADLALAGRRLAETALVPVVVATDGVETALAAQDVHLPSARLIKRFLGRPGDVVHAATPGQEALFGRHRRRVPRRHDPARPAATGSPVGSEACTLAAASREALLDAGTAELLDEALGELGRRTGRRHRPLGTHRTRGAEVVVVAMGAAIVIAEAVADALVADGGPKVGVAGVRALRPFPEAALIEALAGARVALVLERTAFPHAADGPLTAAVRGALGRALENGRAGNRVHLGLPALAGSDAPHVLSVGYGLGGAPLHRADLAALCRDAVRNAAEGKGRATARRARARGPWTPPRWLGLDLVPAGDDYPKRRAFLDRLRRDLPALARFGLRAPQAARPASEADPGPPAAARRAAAATGGDGLAALWDRVGVLYRRGEVDALAAEPLLAAGSLPPASSALASPPARTMLPAFDPAACTGCGVCWTACPEGAIVPAVAAASELIDLGLRRARERGRSADALRMVGGKLAAGLGRALAQPPDGGDAGELLDAAFAPVLPGVPAARREAVGDAFQAVREELAGLPLAATAPYFDAAEAEAAGTGVPLTIVLDPEACTGCGLCVAECAPGALAAAADDPERSAAAGRLLELAAALPPPAEPVLERARRHPESNPLAAALLPPAAREVVWGGGGAEPGSGEAVAARQVLGAAAAHRAADRTRLADRVDGLRRELAAAIHRALEQALPDGDLEALAAGLEAVERPDADLAELTGRVEGALESGRVEVPRLRRLVAAARALADVSPGAAAGEGPAAAPFGVVIAGDAPWAGRFPYNALAVPVTFAAGSDAAGLARGLAAGQVRQTLETLRALRRARVELDKPAEAARAEAEIARLAWRDLDADERRLCPPLAVIVPEHSLGAGDVAELLALLTEEPPVKLLLLAEADSGSAAAAGVPEAAPARAPRSLDPGLVALTLPGAVVAQASIAHAEHLDSAVAAAFALPGPALLRVLAPSPERGGFAADRTLERARAAVASGAFRLFRRDPGEERVTNVAGEPAAGVAAEPTVAARTAAGLATAADGAPRTAAAPPAAAPHAAAEVAAASAVASDAATPPAVGDERLAALAADYENRLGGLRAELEAETAQRVRRRLLTMLLPTPAAGSPASDGAVAAGPQAASAAPPPASAIAEAPGIAPAPPEERP